MVVLAEPLALIQAHSQVTLPEARGICVPHHPGPDQIYLLFFPPKELDFQKSQVQQAGDKFVSVVSQFITLASFSFSDVEDLLTEAKELVRPPMSLRSEQLFSLTSFSLALSSWHCPSEPCLGIMMELPEAMGNPGHPSGLLMVTWQRYSLHWVRAGDKCSANCIIFC